jgi:hypothetical protein
MEPDCPLVPRLKIRSPSLRDVTDPKESYGGIRFFTVVTGNAPLQHGHDRREMRIARI